MIKKSQQPIGIFDSGFGGLTIYKDIINHLPYYDYIYLGDNARSPYGNKSFDIIYLYTKQAVQFLFDQGCPLVILACNTASARALRTIQQNDLPKLWPNKKVLGIIRPTTEELAKFSSTNHIGILATNGTVKSNTYDIEIHKYTKKEIKIFQQACPLWVPIVENNNLSHHTTQGIVAQDITRLLAQSPLIDTILLACTHYPLLYPIIREQTPKHINIIVQGTIVAHSLADYLQRHDEIESQLSKYQSRTYLTTESESETSILAQQFYGSMIDFKHISF